jgi:hypothetical protein
MKLKSLLITTHKCFNFNRLLQMKIRNQSLIVAPVLISVEIQYSSGLWTRIYEYELLRQVPKINLSTPLLFDRFWAQLLKETLRNES